MEKLSHVEPKQVFHFFEEICAIPHGSGNMNAISEYCVHFAERRGLCFLRDAANNVVIYKNGTPGFENAEPVILQGHLDMVCQKTADTDIDFETDGIDIVVDGDFIRARGTTLGADNGIAVAMILAILDSDSLAHPPLEAVFTTDEEIGMIGAGRFDTSVLKGRRMINLDAEEGDMLTVSCAGGSDMKLTLPVRKTTVRGTEIHFEICGLKGGHSGVEIDKGRVNANLLAGRLLSEAAKTTAFDIIAVNGGSKANAIPFCFDAHLITEDGERFARRMNECFESVKKEIGEREETCSIAVTAGRTGDFEAFDAASRDTLLYLLLLTPDGIVNMSAEIEGLVETSLNLGVLATENDHVRLQYALRSNKASALAFLEDRMRAFASRSGCTAELSGRYLPWEYKADSALQRLYAACCEEDCGCSPHVTAIHAGLECAVFAAKMEDLDCIAVGPDMFGVHTVHEALSIPSTKAIFERICKLLAKCG